MFRAVVIAVVIGLGSVGITFWALGENIRTALSVPYWAYLCGLGLACLNYLSGALRLRWLARHAGADLGFVPALRAYALGLTSAAITPSSAGQAPAVAFSLVAGGIPAATAWTINVRVWALDLVFLGWSFPVSVLVLGRSTRLLGNARPELVAIGTFVCALLVVAVLIFRLRWVTGLAASAMQLPGLRRWRDKATDFLERVESASTGLQRAPLRLQGALHSATFLVYFTTYFTFYVMVASMRPAAPLLPTMASAQVPSVASSFFPTPGGVGLLEFGTASLMRLSTRSTTATAAPVAEQEPERAEDLGGPAGGAVIVAAVDDASKARAPVAAAILAWRIFTFYLRMLVGPVLSGAAWRRGARSGAGADAPTG
ncbi:MAG: flippase-like domain-containing protein [Trueperaceae bacterium]|nr:flippase-like domain-containing protein [Trueperaceae bacterium]MCC6309954.1 flippase-like domain-containing protein [Trueperaceae bacterium]MCO5173702.1 flippase-like domain-containing protein [Trueperaceae bacterium]MCW5820784.1 flippase-like domain-containing protein [Trueperaceae bacterium]